MSEKIRARVLVCEDDIATLMQLQKTFEFLGCEVTTATTGTVALFKLRQGDFDLILMDYHMPLKGASETMQAYSSHTSVKMPMVLISSEDHLRDARELGFQAFYAKPITPQVAEGILSKFVPIK